MILLPNRMGYQQHNHTFHQSDSLPPQLAGSFIGAVLLEQRVRIVKDVDGFLEGDAVLALVRARLAWGPTRTESSGDIR